MRNLTYIIQNFKLSMGIVSTDYDQQFLQWAINACTKLNDLGLLPVTTKGVKLPIINHRANLPIDYKEYVRIGICCGGQIVNFDKNDDLCLIDESACACGTSEEISAAIQSCGNVNNNGNNGGYWQYPIFGQPYSWSYSVGSYGYGPGFYHGGYKIDLHKNQIIFDSCVTSQEFILEYIGDFMNDMGNAMIPESPFYSEAITCWMDSERKYWSPDARIRQGYQVAKNRWYQVVRDINSKQQSLNKSEWVQLMRRYEYQGLKG